MKPHKRRLRPPKPARDAFRQRADERAARAALRPHTGHVAVSTIHKPGDESR
jgi:hypothetical protein